MRHFWATDYIFVPQTVTLLGYIVLLGHLVNPVLSSLSTVDNAFPLLLVHIKQKQLYLIFAKCDLCLFCRKDQTIYKV